MDNVEREKLRREGRLTRHARTVNSMKGEAADYCRSKNLLLEFSYVKRLRFSEQTVSSFKHILKMRYSYY